MTCPKCGSEIKEQMLYCSVCGEEIRIVPDFDAAVDDNINLSITGVIDQIDIEDKSKEPTREMLSDTTKEIMPAKQDAPPKKAAPKFKKNSLILFAVIFVSLAALIGVLALNVSRYYSFEYQYEKALEEYDNSQYEESIRTIKHALSIDDTVSKIKLLLVDDYCELDKFDEALAVLYDLLEQYPEDVSLYDKIAKIYEEKGDANSISLLVERADIESFSDSYSQYAKPKLAFSLPSGSYDDTVTLSIDADEGCIVYYTLDGSGADNTKLLYTEPLVFEEGEHTVNAVCYSENGIASDEIRGTYVIDFLIPDMPVTSVQSGKYTEPKLISVTYGNAGAVDADSDQDSDMTAEYNCYYTIDGDDPDTDDILYDAPIAMYIGTHTYKFAVISDKGVSSEVYNLEVTLDVVNLIGMGTAEANLEIWLNTYGMNKGGASYVCEQAYVSEGITYYIINEYSDNKKTGVSYGVDVISGMIYKAKRNTETGEYTLEPVIKPL